VQLSSIDQHSREIGRLGAARLLNRLAGEAPLPQGALVPRLIPRASTAPPPEAVTR
jgi:DNA-binding LacI/PurR family transcriptional regulator